VTYFRLGRDLHPIIELMAEPSYLVTPSDESMQRQAEAEREALVVRLARLGIERMRALQMIVTSPNATR
jgi:hypothetical protein